MAQQVGALEAKSGPQKQQSEMTENQFPGVVF